MMRAAIALLGAIVMSVGVLGSDAGFNPAVAQEAPKAKKSKGLKGSIGYRKAYSYSKSDVIGSDSRRFYDPSIARQGGPFDNGFFYDSAIGLHGGDSPYMQ